MNYVGKAQFSMLIIAPAGTEAEGDRLFSSHAAWMEKTHHREGHKALLQYNVSKSTGDDGNVIYVLTEVYETAAGIADHVQQSGSWELFDDWSKWTSQCQVTYGGMASIIHSLW